MTSASGPSSVPLRQRAVGPDFARGLALLGIALANISGWLYVSSWTVLVKQQQAAPLDRTVDVLVALLADNRGFPLFALLFGYGIGLLWRRAERRDDSPRRFLLTMLQRHLVLFMIGLAHFILLFSGDIIISYAVMGTILLFFVRRRTWVLVGVIACSLPMLAVWGWFDGTVEGGTDGSDPEIDAGSYAESVQLRADGIGEMLLYIPVEDLALLAPMVIGLMMARARLLEDVARHRELLQRLWRVLLPISVLGAMPLIAVMVLDPSRQLLDDDTVLGMLGLLHQLTGLGGAIAYAALAALAGQAWRENRLVSGMAALGRMSMTGYVAQSLVASLAFPSYALGLGVRFGSAGAAVVMTAAWLLTILLAVLLARGGRRGPLEWLLRFLSAPSRASSRQAGGRDDRHRDRRRPPVQPKP